MVIAEPDKPTPPGQPPSGAPSAALPLQGGQDQAAPGVLVAGQASVAEVRELEGHVTGQLLPTAAVPSEEPLAHGGEPEAGSAAVGPTVPPERSSHPSQAAVSAASPSSLAIAAPSEGGVESGGSPAGGLPPTGGERSEGAVPVQPEVVAGEAAESDEEEEEEVPFAPPLELIDEAAEEELHFDWYILKVQVNREDAIAESLRRKAKREGMERYFKEVIVPTEDVVEFTKTGKRRTVKRKLYPGYILVNMAVTDASWFLVRETPGIGDFTGSGGKPTPMDPRDVERILRASKRLPEEEGGGIKTAIPFKPGDRVRVKEGYFQNFEGDVHAIDQTHGRVTVMINIFGRATPVEIEHWQIEAV